MSLNKFLREYIAYAKNDNIKIIESYQNTPKLKPPFLLLNITTQRNLASPVYTLVDRDNYIISQFREVSVDINYYGDDCMEYLDELVHKMHSMRAREYATIHNMTLVEAGSINYLPELINNTDYHKRAVVEAVFRYTTQVTEQYKTIEEVEGVISTHKNTEFHVKKEDQDG